MAIYKQTAINPAPMRPPSGKSEEYVLDRFGLALAGPAAAPAYNTVDGMPYTLSTTTWTPRMGTVVSAARSALVGSTSNPDSNAEDIGARIMTLAQCVRETGIGVEYLEYSTLPITNVSGLFGGVWDGSGDRFVGDIKPIYDATVQNYSNVYDMFTEGVRQQYLKHPLIPYRLANYIFAFMSYYHG